MYLSQIWIKRKSQTFEDSRGNFHEKEGGNAILEKEVILVAKRIKRKLDPENERENVGGEDRGAIWLSVSSMNVFLNYNVQ